MDLKNFETNFLNSISKKISNATINTWFKDLEFFISENDVYIISPHEANKNHLIKNYLEVIEDSISEIAPSFNFIEITTEKKNEVKKEAILEISDSEDSLIEEYKYYSNFNPKYTFDTYMVGDSNKLAYSSALAVAQKPGKLYNPLFIYGNSGLGKTHLMHSIGNYIKKNSEKKVLYITTEQFVNDLILMYKKDEVNKDNLGYIELFRKKYRDIDVLMIDDIQFLGGAIKSQQEFTNTFNSLYDNEKQIIICSDRSVDDLKLLEDRLRTRFNWGLKVNISPPDYELKVNIIKLKIKNTDLIIDLNDDIVNYVASNCGSDVRNIEGFITRLCAYQAIMNIPKLSIEDAIEALKEYTNSLLFSPNTMKKILNVVAKYFELSVDDLKGKKRNALISQARHIAFYLCRIMTDDSYIKIGMEMGNRNHATAIHSFEKIKHDLLNNKQLGNMILEIKSKISE